MQNTSIQTDRLSAAIARMAECFARTIIYMQNFGASNSDASSHSESQLLVSRVIGCAVKGGGPQRELNPPGNWFAPPGSNRSSGGGNEAAEAFGVEGRIGDSASMQAVT